MMPIDARENFVFVLVSPKSSGNVGAAARALMNMGFAALRLVAPRGYDPPAAARRAVHAAGIVERAQCFDRLSDALADRTLTIGTTARTGTYRGEARELRATAPEIATLAANNRVAIVFGPEDYGLANREIAQCQWLLTIPSAPAYPSLNLAHAVAIVAYELALALDGAPRPVGCDEEFAPAATVEAMHQRMERALIAIGFLPEANPGHIMHTLRAMLGRGGLRPREVEILNGVARQIAWVAGDGAATLAAKRRDGRKLR